MQIWKDFYKPFPALAAKSICHFGCNLIP